MAAYASHGAGDGPERCEPADNPRWGPCPTASVARWRMGCAVTRRRRERVSREGGGSTWRNATQTRVAQIRLKLGLAGEGGPYPFRTQPLKVSSNVGWETRSSRTMCAASRMAGGAG